MENCKHLWWNDETKRITKADNAAFLVVTIEGKDESAKYSFDLCLLCGKLERRPNLDSENNSITAFELQQSPETEQNMV